MRSRCARLLRTCGDLLAALGRDEHRQRTRWIVLIAMLDAASCVPAIAADSPSPTPLRLSVAVGPAFALGRAAQNWAREVRERTGGALEVKVFVGATLSGRDAGLEFTALREGAANLAVGSTLVWSEQVPALAVASLPWMAPTDRQLAALATGLVAERLRAAVQAAGVVPLAFAPMPHRALATRTDRVHAPGDLAALRVRVAASPLLLDLYATLGARPVVLTAEQAREALTAGTLDAQEATPVSFVASRAPALGLRYITVWSAVGELAVFAVNRATWNGWSTETQELVRSAADAAAVELAGAAPRETAVALETLRQRGVTITRLLPAAQAGFAAAAHPVTARWAERIGEDLVREAEAASRAAAR